MPNKTIIALTGHPSSGKDSVAKFLVEKGFVNVSLGDIVREYITKNNLGDHSRENLQKVGNELRKKYGPGYFAKEALKKDFPKIIISGVRAIGEAEFLKQMGVPIVAVTAPIEKRYEWARARNRIAENISFEEFKKIEDSEARSVLPYEMNVNAVIKMSDYQIKNIGTLDELKLRSEKILSQIEGQ